MTDRREDEAFERYLRQFQFRPPRELPAAARVRRYLLMSAAAAVLIAASGLSVGLWREHRRSVPETVKMATPTRRAEEPPLTLGRLRAAGDDRVDELMDDAAVTMLPSADRGAFRLLARD